MSAIEVYWRPGCPYCTRLAVALRDADVDVVTHNIWEDDEARQFVRAHNNGAETVPTVVLGDSVMTNPHPARLLELLESRPASLKT